LFGCIERRELLAQVAVHYVLHATRVCAASEPQATLFYPRKRGMSCHARTTDARSIA
jgi:hypothetical protein